MKVVLKVEKLAEMTVELAVVKEAEWEMSVEL